LAVNSPFKTDKRQVEMVFGQLPHQKAANCHIKMEANLINEGTESLKTFKWGG